MKAKFGAIVVDGRGKAGGHVFTKNRQGAAMRTKVTPINRRTNSQQTAKVTLADLSDNWKALTQAQRDTWDNASQDVTRRNIFGDGYHPTGKNLYMIINQGLALAGVAAVTSPPATTPATALTAFAVGTNTTAAQTLTFTATPVPAGMMVQVQGTRPLSAGSNAPSGKFRNFTTVVAAATSPLNSFAAYQTKFGTPISGKKIFFRAFVVNITTGARSLPLQASGITA